MGSTAGMGLCSTAKGEDSKNDDNTDAYDDEEKLLTAIDIIATLVGYIVERFDLRMFASGGHRVIAFLHIDHAVVDVLQIQLDVVDQPVAQHQSAKEQGEDLE